MKDGNNKKKIYLADLTHDWGNAISSSTYPLGVGLVAAALLERFPDNIEIELFKYPQDLNTALSKEIPHIMGFSNYSWNCNLAYAFASQIKNQSPSTVIVFGGPNYSLEPKKMKQFWEDHPLCDFHIIREGELAMIELFKSLLSFDFFLDDIRSASISIPNCHYVFDGSIIAGNDLPRVDVNSFPSPYLLGLMDKFFDKPLTPLVYTTRGCPFRCTYCVEGDRYYQKVMHRSDLQDEFEYIARRATVVSDISITDANFGMYKEDIDKAKMIAEIQKRYQWPEFIVVCWGKNVPDRLIEVASILKDSVALRSSLQSSDPAVLKNVGRSNISIKAMHAVAKSGLDKNGDTLTEVILGLPGDTVETHTETLRNAVDAGFTQISVYQLSLLAETLLDQDSYREKFEMKTKFRNLPRSLGQYDVLGKEIRLVEYEEICVGTNTMSFDDYIYCRELGLTIEIVHNDGVFSELMGLCQKLGISWFDLILRFFSNRRKLCPEIAKLYDYFTGEATGKLWNGPSEVIEYFYENLNEFKEGTNELTTARYISFFKLQDHLHDALYNEMSKLLKERCLMDNTLLLYLDELKEFSLLRKKDLIRSEAQYVRRFHFDFNAIEKNGFAVNPRDFMLEGSINIVFFHNDKQKERIAQLMKQYGTTAEGLGRFLYRVQTRKLFRQIALTAA